MSFQPPPLNYAQPPYGRVPLPRQFIEPLTLDPLLQFAQKGAAISWSVSEHPTSAAAQMLLPYGEVWQIRPATSPTTSALTIWWSTGDRPIVVRRDSYVTVADVLFAVSRFCSRHHICITHPHLPSHLLPATNKFGTGC